MSATDKDLSALTDDELYELKFGLDTRLGDLKQQLAEAKRRFASGHGASNWSWLHDSERAARRLGQQSQQIQHEFARRKRVRRSNEKDFNKGVFRDAVLRVHRVLPGPWSWNELDGGTRAEIVDVNGLLITDVNEVEEAVVAVKVFNAALSIIAGPQGGLRRKCDP